VIVTEARSWSPATRRSRRSTAVVAISSNGWAMLVIVGRAVEPDDEQVAGHGAAALGRCPDRTHRHLVVAGEDAVDVAIEQRLPGVESRHPGEVALSDEGFVDATAGALVGQPISGEPGPGIGAVRAAGDAADPFAALLEQVRDGECRRLQVLDVDPEHVVSRRVGPDQDGGERRVEQLVDPRSDRHRADQQAVDEPVTEDVVHRPARLGRGEVEHEPEIALDGGAAHGVGHGGTVRVDA
jgi:hypothetical protein